MKKLKRKIINTLREGTVTSKELEDTTRKLVDVAKSELDLKDDKTAKEYVAGFIKDGFVHQANQNESDEIASNGIAAGMNPEVEADKYEEMLDILDKTSPFGLHKGWI